MGELLNHLKEMNIALEEGDTVESVVTKIEGYFTNNKDAIIINNNDHPTYLPKERYDSVKSKLTETETKLGLLDTSFKDLETKVTDSSSLVEENTKLKGEFDSYKMQSSAEILGVKHRVRDFNDIKPLLDFTKVTTKEDGTYEGLSEQFDALKTSKSYFFLNEGEQNIGAGSSPATGGTGTVKDVADMSMPEYIASRTKK